MLQRGEACLARWVRGAKHGRRRGLRRWPVAVLIAAAFVHASALPAAAQSVTLNDGRVLTGRIGSVVGIAEDPNAPAKRIGEVDVQPILIVDNGLVRTFVPKANVKAVGGEAAESREKVRIRQPVARSGFSVGSVGPIVRITPFDEHGRRIFSMATDRGQVDVIQGITEITPVYTKVEGLLGGKKPYVWEMRISTHSLPRETLSRVLSATIDTNKPEERLKVVRLLLESERYADAEAELEKVLADFPALDELQAELRSIREFTARRLLREIETRREAGQHALVKGLLAHFPTENVAGETLQHVRGIQEEYVELDRLGEAAIAQLRTQLAGIDDASLAERAREPCAEIEKELNYTTLDRLASFMRLADDPEMGSQQKVALAVSGWILGSDAAAENLPIALSHYSVRNLVRQYLAEPSADDRREILQRLRTEEGASPAEVARLLIHMKSLVENPLEEGNAESHYEQQVEGLPGDTNIRYLVQLPPDYDPYRRYPAVLTLNGAGSSPEMQVDWWAGQRDSSGRRLGQATRHGYITVAVDWQRPHQRQYEFSAREHHAVLSSLRDACRRFSIDTDRVFLSGHDIGGDAAWDLALAHPDLWAGAIPIVAVADRYCTHYWENARHVPFYVVAGELDGDKIRRNARDLDRYLRRHFDATVVEYLGRGHEHFYEEIQKVFEWMAGRRRDFFPKEFTCATMREWDNFFWWVEVADFPQRAAVAPVDWPPPRGTRPLKVNGSIKATNTVFVRGGTSRATIWLAPEIIDFSQRIEVHVDGRRVTGPDVSPSPDLAVLLEDARTRGDRQHPFWAKVTYP